MAGFRDGGTQLRVPPVPGHLSGPKEVLCILLFV